MAIKLVSMKLPKKTKKQLKDECVPCDVGDRERYPYGLRLSLNEKEQIEKLGLQNLEAGAMVDIQAVGKVVEVSVTNTDTKKKDYRRLEIQIHKIGIADKSSYDQSFEEATREP